MQREKKPETVPAWAENARPLEETLVIPNKDGEVLSSFNNEYADRHLARKNILAHGLHILFV